MFFSFLKPNFSMVHEEKKPWGFVTTNMLNPSSPPLPSWYYQGEWFNVFFYVCPQLAELLDLGFHIFEGIVNLIWKFFWS